MDSLSSLWWCKNCGVPLLRKECENCRLEGVKICSDLKPMFEEECRFLEKEASMKLPGKSWEDGLWMRHKTIWLNGKRLLRLSAKGSPIVIKQYSDNSSYLHCRSTCNILYGANKSTLDELEKKAISFIEGIVESYPKRKPVVSFSGGKDSSIVSYLVGKALGADKVLHVFGNTSMEYPDTLNYIKRFFGNNRGIPFRENSTSQGFLEMCRLIGPPSRINAWCCTVFKAGPIAAVISKINGEDGVVSFEGIRRKESVRRRNRQKIYLNKKIAHQLSAYPILDWKDIEVWLYILTKGLDFNDAYKRGFSRVGCMYCPNNTPYNEYLITSYYPTEAQKWTHFLLDYAKKIGKEYPLDYVSSGAWKMRVGKSEGRSLAYVKKVSCLKNANAMHFILDKRISADFIERFKPFGLIQELSGDASNGFVARDALTGEGLFMIKRVNDISILKKESRIDPSWKLDEEFLCVDMLTTKNTYHLLQTIERQLRKFQVCVLCGACTSICPTNAIKITPHFAVSEDKCTHCGRCISSKYIPFGCVTLNSTRTGRE